MAYIGAEPVPGQNREVDDISSGFNGNATAFTLQVSSVNVSPESANNILINLGGVLQNPGTDYTVAASTLTFTTAPAAGLSFFGLILGAGINTATVADDTIGASKLIDTAVTAGSYTTADITVDAQGRITAAANGTISGAEIADQAVTNAKVNNSAAIAGTKISPDFGSQNIVTTGSISGAAGTLTGDLTIPDTIVHTGDTNTKIRFPAADTFSVETAGSERMRIDSSGRLLLGASTSAIVGGGGASLYQIETTSQNAISCVAHRGTGNASGSIFILGKSRGTSAGAVTSVGINDELGSLRFAGADDTDLQSRGGEISCEVDGTPGSNDMPGRLLFKTTADGSAAPTERMRIDSSGRVLIGGTSIGSASSYYDDVVISNTASGTGAGLTFIANATNGFSAIDFADTAAGGRGRITYSHGDDRLMIDVAGNEAMRIDSSGNVGIGTTSPDRTIHCHNSSNTTNVRTKFSNGTTGEGASDGFEIGINASDPAQAVLVNNENSPMAFFTNATEKMHLTSKGGLRTLMDDGDSVVALFKRTAGVNSHNLFEIRYSGSTPTSGGTLSFAIETDGDVKNTNNSYGSLSDLKLKENIVDAKSQWDDIKALKVRNYNFKSDTGFQSHTQIGLVAQEVELVSSGLVIDSIDRDDDGKDLGTTTKSLRYSVLHIKALKALQEAMAKIETLETKVAALEAA